MKQWWQCTIITMYENLRLCTLLFLTLLLTYGNSGSSNHNLSLLILVIRECILNLLKSCDQGSSRKIQKWQSGNSRIILTFYLNPRRIFYFSFFFLPRGFFLKSPTPSHTQCLPLSLSLFDLKYNSNISSLCREILRLLLRPEPLGCQKSLVRQNWRQENWRISRKSLILRE